MCENGSMGRCGIFLLVTILAAGLCFGVFYWVGHAFHPEVIDKGASMGEFIEEQGYLHCMDHFNPEIHAQNLEMGAGAAAGAGILGLGATIFDQTKDHKGENGSQKAIDNTTKSLAIIGVLGPPAGIVAFGVLMAVCSLLFVCFGVGIFGQHGFGYTTIEMVMALWTPQIWSVFAVTAVSASTIAAFGYTVYENWGTPTWRPDCLKSAMTEGDGPIKRRDDGSGLGLAASHVTGGSSGDLPRRLMENVKYDFTLIQKLCLMALISITLFSLSVLTLESLDNLRRGNAALKNLSQVRI